MSKPKKTDQEREFIDEGPPPELRRRQLIFDSLQKITQTNVKVAQSKAGGTYGYTWGAGYHGQLGRKLARGQKKYASTPQFVGLGCGIRQVACGGLHSAVVTVSGKVKTWGDGRFHQLGHSREGFVNQPTPRMVGEVTQIVQVACGTGHTLALTDAGEVFSWGYGKYGQLGHGDRSSLKIPQKINLPFNVSFAEISCGDKHCLGVTKSNEVFAWGSGEHGQLGTSDQQDVLAPTKLELEEKMSKVSAGSIFSAFVSVSGNLYLAGFGEYLYTNLPMNFYYSPTRIASVKERIKDVAAGQSHIVCLTYQGDVLAWGSSEYGQIGHGLHSHSSHPKLVLEGKKIIQVAAGRYHSVALTGFGALYAWGNNDNGQLGQSCDENILLPKVVEPILSAVVGQISCGEHHTFALTSVRWGKLSDSVEDWLQAERHEYELKIEMLKKSTHGIARRELHEEMEKWRKSRIRSVEEAKTGEKQEIENDLNLIVSKSKVKADALKKQGKLLEYQAPSDSLAVPKQRKQVKARRPKQRKRPVVSSTGRNTKIKHEALPSESVVNNSRLTYLKNSANFLGDMLVTFCGDSTSSTDGFKRQQLNEVFEAVCSLRREYDSLKHLADSKSQGARQLQKEIEYMNSNSSMRKREENLCRNQLKNLTMQLDTVTIKITETEENRRNYELNIAHLKEEELERFFYMEDLRKEGAETNALYRKMLSFQKEALRAETEAVNSLTQMRSEMKEFQKFTKAQTSSFRQLFEAKANSNSDERTVATKRSDKAEVRHSRHLTALNQKWIEKQDESRGFQLQLEKINEKTNEFLEVFHTIQQATGLSNPDEIIQKFRLKEELRKELEQESEKKKTLLQSVLEKKEKSDSELQEIKSSFVTSRWREVDELQDEFVKQQAECSNVRSSIQDKVQTLKSIQQGFSAILVSLELDDPEVEQLQNTVDWTGDDFNTCLKHYKLKCAA